MTISVIVPFCNHASTLKRCIDSVLAQTFIDFELLMISDGSTDASIALVCAAAKKDPRVRLILCTHQGVSAARNQGIRQAAGDWIGFVDADDYMESNMLEVMLGAALKENADLAVCNFTHPFFSEYIGNQVLDFGKTQNRLWYYQHTFAAQVPWNKLYRREAIKEGFIEGLDYCEDGLFSLANMHHVRKAVTLDQKLYNYCVAAPSDAAEASTITKIAQSGDLGKSRDTFWYKRAELFPQSIEILRRNVQAEEIADFAYVRIFDFMLWELLIFLEAGAEKRALTRDIQVILCEPLFREALWVKEKYGLRFQTLTRRELNERTVAFVDACYFAKEQMRHMKKASLRPIYVYCDLYLRFFCEAPCLHRQLNPIDLAANEMLNLIGNKTPEAVFVNAMLASRFRYSSELHHAQAPYARRYLSLL